MRTNKYRVDRYFLFTLNPYPHNVKVCFVVLFFINALILQLAGWRQTSDLPTLQLALSKIKLDGTVSLSEGIGSAFKLLNLNRMHAGFENYGMVSFVLYLRRPFRAC